MTKRGNDGWNAAWENLEPLVAMMANSGMASAMRGNARRGFGVNFSGEDDARSDWPRTGRRVGAGRRGRMFAQGELRLALLALIDAEPRHGYELIKAIEDMTGGSYAPSPGAVYPTLQILADEGQIEEAKSEGAKKPFKSTASGKAELADREGEVENLMERLDAIGEKAKTVRSPDLFRAMSNLATVLRNKASAGKFDKDGMDQIVDIIDEVAKRIERL